VLHSLGGAKKSQGANVQRWLLLQEERNARLKSVLLETPNKRIYRAQATTLTVFDGEKIVAPADGLPLLGPLPPIVAVAIFAEGAPPTRLGLASTTPSGC
jgi:hypothetical protein